MAHIEPMGLEGLDKIHTGLRALTTGIDKIVIDCLDKAAPVGERAYKGALQGSGLPRRVSTSVDTLKPKKNDLGVYTVSRAIGFREKDGLRYAALAAYFEYGTKEHTIKRRLHTGTVVDQKISGMASRPWHSAAVSAAEGPVTKIVQETFYEKVKELTGQ